MSALGPTADQMRNQLTRQDVYLLESNELLTVNELFSGLAKIGAEYGRSDASVKDNVQLYHKNYKTQRGADSKSKFGKNR